MNQSYYFKSTHKQSANNNKKERNGDNSIKFNDSDEFSFVNSNKSVKMYHCS